jgi:hypothetical protein
MNTEQNFQNSTEASNDGNTVLPAVLLDDEGYPTEEWLQFIKTYKPDESLPLLTFVKKVLVDGWYMSDWGFVLHRKYKGIHKLELHTGGWSGNEETIAAITSNMWLTHFQMRYVMWRTGGHYYFELSVG